MDFTARSKHAILALMAIALNTDHKPVRLVEIATHTEICISYLERIFAKLKNAGILKSARGPGGGYSLARSPAHITLADIFSAIEAGSVVDTACSSVGLEKPQMWQVIKNSVRHHMELITLQSLIEAASTEGIQTVK